MSILLTKPTIPNQLLIKLRITDNDTYPPTEAKYLSIKEYLTDHNANYIWWEIPPKNTNIVYYWKVRFLDEHWNEEQNGDETIAMVDVDNDVMIIGSDVPFKLNRFKFLKYLGAGYNKNIYVTKFLD